ncbi:branched-chain amino acid ABC transporter permease [Microvirga soli]|uniref:branched-chain amino acid ABC transporter permease n=1 Tax=Microvirga soli TaxID=1854496 RepID=UPI00191EA306|nr:branched-chain amino acid ABC transporter permease [Microvirga soli]
MLSLEILLHSVVTGLMNGAVYALVAMGLTLIFGVLHIINFAHGSLLMVAMYGVFFAVTLLGIDPYVTIPFMMALMYFAGYGLQRYVIGNAGQGRDTNILLITLGAAVVMDNLALYLWTGDTRQLQLDYMMTVVDLGFALIPVTRIIAFVAACALFVAMWLVIERTNFGRAMRAVAKEPFGARVVGIDVDRVYAQTMGIGTACLGAAAALLLPIFYVNPQIGNVFVLLAFTIVVLGSMGNIVGALVGGLLVGLVESVGGFFLGDRLGQVGIFVIFILILTFRPQGLFSARV